MKDCEDCLYLLERIEYALDKLRDHAEWHGTQTGQPRQADPSGAASLSTTSEQPADPAAWPKYHGLCYCSSTQTCSYCRLPGHDEPHKSFGGVQW